MYLSPIGVTAGRAFHLEKIVDLTEDHMEVLRRLRDGRVLPLADRKQDRVRQQLRKAGLIKCVMNPRRWILTSNGSSILTRVEASAA